jgi:putative transcriptional regulator
MDATITVGESRGPGQRDVARATGIHRTTLYKIGSKRGYNTTTENLSRLCRFFECQLGDVAQYVPDEDVLTVDPPAADAVPPRKRRVTKTIGVAKGKLAAFVPDADALVETAKSAAKKSKAQPRKAAGSSGKT